MNTVMRLRLRKSFQYEVGLVSIANYEISLQLSTRYSVCTWTLRHVQSYTYTIFGMRTTWNE